MWTRSELKSYAKAKLAYSYWPIVGVTFLVGLIPTLLNVEIPTDQMYQLGYISGDTYYLLSFVNLVIVFAGFFLGIFVFGPLKVGLMRYYINQETRTASISDLFYPFKHNYWNVVGVLFLQGLYTFLWTLLFLIPGIIKGYEYLMIPYLLAEKPDMKASEVFKATKRMMDGNKWDTFVLYLSFIGWIFLAILTIGLLDIFFVTPYLGLTMSELYLALKSRVDYLFDDFESGEQVVQTEETTQYSYWSPYDNQ